MKRYGKLLLGMVAVTIVGCGQRSETLNNADTVNVSKNQQLSRETTVAETTVTNATTTTTENATTGEQNALAKEAIKEIETKKQVVLDSNYLIIVQSQTADTININIRHKMNNNVSSTFGFFRYNQATKVLEEMDSVTGEYKQIK